MEAMLLKPRKHLSGQHNQATHGRHAISAPSEAEVIAGSYASGTTNPFPTAVESGLSGRWRIYEPQEGKKGYTNAKIRQEFQQKVAGGPNGEEVHVVGTTIHNGDVMKLEYWADGVLNDNGDFDLEGGWVCDAKHILSSKKSPWTGENKKIPEFVENIINGYIPNEKVGKAPRGIRWEMFRAAKIALDSGNSFKGVWIKTNNPKVQNYFTSLLREFGLSENQIRFTVTEDAYTYKALTVNHIIVYCVHDERTDKNYWSDNLHFIKNIELRLMVQALAPLQEFVIPTTDDNSIDNCITIMPVVIPYSEWLRTFGNAGKASKDLASFENDFNAADLLAISLKQEGQNMPIVLKHLTGQHDQSTHGVGGTGAFEAAPNYEAWNVGRDHPCAACCRAGIDVSRDSVLPNSNRDWKTNEEIYTDGEMSAMQHYSGNGYGTVNNYLRNGQLYTDSSAENNKKVNDRTMETIKNLDSAFNGPPLSKDISMTRALEPNDAFTQALIEGVKSKGKDFSFTDKGYTSVTVKGNEANLMQSFNPSYMPNKLWLTVNISKGSKALHILPFSQHPDDKELLLPRNGTFKFNSIDSEGLYIFDYIEGQ